MVSVVPRNPRRELTGARRPNGFFPFSFLVKASEPLVQSRLTAAQRLRSEGWPQGPSPNIAANASHSEQRGPIARDLSGGAVVWPLWEPGVRARGDPWVPLHPRAVHTFSGSTSASLALLRRPTHRSPNPIEDLAPLRNRRTWSWFRRVGQACQRRGGGHPSPGPQSPDPLFSNPRGSGDRPIPGKQLP